MPALTIYSIHRKQLLARETRLHGTLQTIRTTAQSAGYDVRIVMILKHDPEDLYPRLADLQKNTKYDPVGIPEFDRRIAVLSLDIISNIEKHRDAWARITEQATKEGASKDDLYMVIEDDTLVMPDCVQNLADLFGALKENPAWDMVFCGISDPDPAAASAPMALKPTRAIVDILPCKEAYFVRPATAMQLRDKTEQYTFSARMFLSFMIHTHPMIRSMHPTRRVTLEGSKLGFFPSTLHPNNMLILNREYMTMFEMMQKPEAPNLAEVVATYDKISSLRSPDALHLLGVLFFRMGMYKDAEKILIDALEELRKQQGFLNNQSDVMNNLIQVYQRMQPDLQECAKLPSKYAPISA